LYFIASLLLLYLSLNSSHTQKPQSCSARSALGPGLLLCPRLPPSTVPELASVSSFASPTRYAASDQDDCLGLMMLTNY
jgi:hypothetical protein